MMLERFVTVRASQPAALAEILQRAGTEVALLGLAAGGQRSRGALPHRSQKVGEGKLGDRGVGLDPLLRGALLAQMQRRDRIIHDLRQVNRRAALMAVV